MNTYRNVLPVMIQIVMLGCLAKNTALSMSGGRAPGK